MAKAGLGDLRKAENWSELGRVVKRTWQLSGLSLKEFAREIERNERQIARWTSAQQRPQIETVFAAPQLRRWLVVALAELAGAGVEIDTVVRISQRVA